MKGVSGLIAMICIIIAIIMAFMFGLGLIITLIKEHPLGFFISIVIIGFIAYTMSDE